MDLRRHADLPIFDHILKQRHQSLLDSGFVFFAATFLFQQHSSGTQTNLIGLLSHCQRGHEYIVGQAAHTYTYEGGGAAVLGGIQPCPLPFEADGTLQAEVNQSPSVEAELKRLQAEVIKRQRDADEKVHLVVSGILSPAHINLPFWGFCPGLGPMCPMKQIRHINGMTSSRGI